MTKSTACILETLQGCPSGLSAKEVADRLGASPSNIGSRLSKLAAYGIIQKRRGRIASDVSPCAIYFAQSPESSAGTRHGLTSNRFAARNQFSPTAQPSHSTPPNPPKSVTWISPPSKAGEESGEPGYAQAL